MAEFHWLRPFWLWSIVPVIFVFLGVWQQKSATKVWSKICDAHLLDSLLVHRGRVSRTFGMSMLILGVLCLIIALAGPTWTKIGVPIYQHMQPRVVVLDLSQSMLSKDLAPDRLTRAKFKIHDLLMQANAGQFGLMVYSSEPFVVSPLTDDAQTIDTLLSSLTPDILPVDGNRLDHALEEVGALFTEVGMSFGDILVLTAQIPSPSAVDAAQTLSARGYHVSVMPLLADTTASSLFSPLAKAGRGEVVMFKDSPSDIKHWLSLSRNTQHYQMNQRDAIPLWRDDGRWFLLPGLLLLLPICRRGWLERIKT
ncbi:MAG: hypothetical protein CK424_05935 [Legionella sp.]|nr:MAG: hypothetical protein CK424_05935 [Legionella sp.]